MYVEARDEGDDATATLEREELLPQLGAGEIVAVDSLEPRGHTTSAPPRYTEASLVKRLEELGIGRPSTWASIIQTIQDRGYVWKKGQALVPTWTAFAVVGLLEQHFDELVDYAFTAKVETDLDAIAAGDQKKDEWLHEFYFGDDPASDDALPGLKRLVEENLDNIDAAAINTFPIGHDAEGNLVVVKPGRFGPYVKRGDDTAGVPDDLPPDELTIDAALALLAAPKADEPIGELDGLPVFAKNGRYGPYVQLGTPDNPPPGLDKPKMASLLKSMTLERLTLGDAEMLLSLPRTVGVDPADGEPVLARNGPHGPYVQKGKENRSLDSEERLFTVTLEEALELLAAPKVYKRGGRNMAAQGPLREFGNDPVSGRPVVARDGRFGVYVTDGETNASIGRGDRIEEMAPERAFELLAVRREQVAAKGGTAQEGRGEPAQEDGGEEDGGEEEGCGHDASEGQEAVSAWGIQTPKPVDPPARPTSPWKGRRAAARRTQAALLGRLARRRAHARDRRHGRSARRLRQILHDNDVTELDARAEALIAAADRAQHIAEVVLPALRAGRTVVSDRSVYSTLAYQGYGRQLDLAELRRFNDWAVQGVWPSLVVYIEAHSERRRRPPQPPRSSTASSAPAPRSTSGSSTGSAASPPTTRSAGSSSPRTGPRTRSPPRCSTPCGQPASAGAVTSVPDDDSIWGGRRRPGPRRRGPAPLLPPRRCTPTFSSDHRARTKDEASRAFAALLLTGGEDAGHARRAAGARRRAPRRPRGRAHRTGDLRRAGRRDRPPGCPRSRRGRRARC